MWDKKRAVINDLAVIEGLIIHHSAGNRMLGSSPEEVFQALNKTGFTRGYAPYGYDFSTGYSKQYGQNFHTHDGRISFCEYHYALYEHEPGYYQLVSLIDDPMWTDAGSVWKAEFNRVAVACVFCGNFEAENVSEKMVEYFIGLFRKGSPLSWLLHKNPGLWVKGHKDTGDATACPGKYLHTYIPRIEREIKSMEV